MIELLGVSFALLYVLLAIRESVWCWAAAVISSLCYIHVFFHAALYTESALQLFFIGLSLQGFRRWGLRERQLDVQRYPIARHLIGIALGAVFSLVLGVLVWRLTAAPYALADAAITVFSIYATFLATEKVLESWLYWIVIDAGAVVLYFIKGLEMTAALYGLYIILAFVGYQKWKRSLEREPSSL